MIFRSKAKIPGWFVGLVVLVTGLLTFWTMLQRNDGQLWATEAATFPQRVTQVFAPATTVTHPGSFQQVAQPPTTLRPVAASRPVPPIQAGAPSPHGDRGACTLCHLVVDRVGAAIPMIPALASLPHQYRGVCTNCHQVNGAAGSPLSPNPVAAAAALAPGGAGSWSPVAAIQGRPLPTAPADGAWLGMELVPISPLVQQQYSLPAGVNGLAVAEAEAQAMAAGVQPGDVLLAINGTPVQDLPSLQQATAGLTLTSGSLDLLRQGQLLRVVVGLGPAMQAPPFGQAPPVGQAPPAGQAMLPMGAVPGYGLPAAPAATPSQGQPLNTNPYPSAGGAYPAQQ